MKLNDFKWHCLIYLYLPSEFLEGSSSLKYTYISPQPAAFCITQDSRLWRAWDYACSCGDISQSVLSACWWCVDIISRVISHIALITAQVIGSSKKSVSMFKDRGCFQRQGSRLILPTGRTFETNFLSFSHEHIIWSHFFFLIHLINKCMLIFIA